MCMTLACVCLVVMCPSTATATKNSDGIDFVRISSITDNATTFLNSTGYENTLTPPVPMYNFNEEIETLYYPLQPTGYLIASYKDGHIIEFSPETQRLVDTSGKLYYNGVMEYYKVANNEQLIQILSNDIVGKGNLQIAFDGTLLEQIPALDYQLSTSTYGLEPNNPPPIAANCVEWEDNYQCTITGITNLLQYYHDIMNVDVYASNVNSSTSLRKFLNQGEQGKGYIYGGGLYFNIAVNKHAYYGQIYLGLRAYFNRSDVDTYTVNTYKSGEPSISDVKIQLNTYARPVLLSLNTSALIPSRSSLHTVLAYSYMETANTTYFIVNDGWGGNYTYICIDDINLPDLAILYLS